MTGRKGWTTAENCIIFIWTEDGFVPEKSGVQSTGEFIGE
jgi:hypothetical protein